MIVIRLLKLIGKWAFLNPAEVMEGVGVGVESAQDSVLPSCQGKNVLHSAAVYMTW